MFFCESLVILGACMTNAEITNVSISERKPLYTTSVDASGFERDVEKFYDGDIPGIYLEGRLTFDTNTRITLGVDPGVRADKYKKDPSYTVSIDQYFNVTDNSWLSFSAQTLLGGKEEHTPCYTDEVFNGENITRDWHCGTMEAWSWFERDLVEPETPYNVTIKYTIRF